MCVSGDERADSQIGLTSLYTLVLRHHNNIESRLHELNPHWTGNKLFEESRRVVIATIQHVTYGEYLPALLGNTAMRNYGLKLNDKGFYEGMKSVFIINSFMSTTSIFYNNQYILQRRQLFKIS